METDPRTKTIAEAGVLGEFPYLVLHIEWPHPPGFKERLRVPREWMNGYVGVPPGHPWYGKEEYGDLDVDCHGGLTFSGHFTDNTYALMAGEPWAGMDIWWVGFDTVHFDDHDLDGAWTKSQAYVKAECERIAQQAAEAYSAVC